MTAFMLMTSIFLGTIFSTSTVHSNETSLRGKTFCFPAKSVPKLVDEIASVKEKYRNVVDVKLDPKFLIKDGGDWPERFYLSDEGKIVTDFQFSREDGRVPNFIEAVRAAPQTDICVDDPTRADRPADDEGLYFEMGLSPLFANRSGRHSVDELREGTKDGKKFYKKMLPDPLAFLMPSTDHLAVKYEDPNTPIQAYALVDGEEQPLTAVGHDDYMVLSCKEIEKMGAEALIIKGGPYHLQPVPSPKVLRRFGLGQAAEK
jgi:hypothetical protein